MKTKKLLLIIPILSFIIGMMGGCKKYCPGFPDELADYLPYAYGEEMVFANNNDTITFQIYSFYQSQSEEISSCGMCMCNLPFISFHARPLTTNLFFEAISVDIILVNPKLLESYIRLKPDDSFVGTNYFDSATDTIIVNNTNPTRISKALIIKGKGLASFYDITTNSEWILIEK